VGIYNGNIVVFAGKHLGQVKADFTISGYNCIHICSNKDYSPQK